MTDFVSNDSLGNPVAWGQIQRAPESFSRIEPIAASNQAQIPDVSNQQSDGTFDDPAGDTFGFSTPQLDIESVSGTVTGDELNLRVDFFTTIAPPSSFSSNSVVGYIDLDLDQNATTGISSFQSGFAPPGQQGGPLGDEAFIDLFSESSQPGLVNIVNPTDFSTIGQLPISYESDFFEVRVPLELLEDSDGVNFGTVVGTPLEATDAAPNTEFASVALPPPPPIIGTENDDVLTGTNRGEQISGLGGDDILQGLGGRDQIFGNQGNDLIAAGNGNDTVEGGTGNDQISGEQDDDSLAGNDGRDDILGGDGNDTINGGASNDRLLGEAGNDSIAGEDGNDTVDGGEGDDTVASGNGNDRAFGGSGNDNLTGDSGTDTLTGSFGNDTLDGGDGNDRLIGVDPLVAGSEVGFGAGELDNFTGGAGRDTFVLGDATRVYYEDGDSLTTGESDYALITDFNPAQDVIQLQGSADAYNFDFFTTGEGRIDAALLFDTGVTAREELIGILQNVSPELNLTVPAFTFV